jgi:hypothetical protein
MVLCLTLREAAITQLNTRQRRAAPLWSQSTSTEGTAVNGEEGPARAPATKELEIGTIWTARPPQ